MSGFWTVHSFSDPGGLAGSTIHGVAISSPPQSMYITDSVIDEKVSQGEQRDSIPPLPPLFFSFLLMMPIHTVSKTIGLAVPRVQQLTKS